MKSLPVKHTACEVDLVNLSATTPDLTRLSDPQAFILHLQRLSTEDGPGLRTTVFFKGCPLRCAWCHNPESISPKAQLQWLETRCIGCRTCLSVCPSGSLHLDENGMTLNRETCNVCGLCVEACPGAALEMLGVHISLDGLMREVLKDRAYYDKSQDGGVTLSGGEPLMQPEFVLAFLQRLKAENIHTALDTCGLVSRQALERALPFTDLILFDIKEMDSRKHENFTGQRNERILENLAFLAAAIRENGSKTRLWVRTPLIPGATATAQNVAAIGAHIASLDGLVARWDLLAFNNLAKDKFRRLDLDWPFADTPLLSQQELAYFDDIARTSGVDASIVNTSGAVNPNN